MSGAFFFAIFGALAALTSLLVILQRNPLHSALFLVISFINVAAIYVLLGAEFVAVTQVIVYTGAILVLILFAIMLVRAEDLPEMYGGHPVQGIVGPILGVALFLEVVAVIASTVPLGPGGAFTPDAIAAQGGNIQALARSLYSEFLIPFEIASLVLLVGAIGAIVLARPDETPARVAETRRLFTISLGHPTETPIAEPDAATIARDAALLRAEERATETAGETLPR